METLPSYDELSQMTDQQLTNIFGVRDFFTYNVEFSGIAAAGGTAQQDFTVMSDSNFLWQYGAFFADVAGAAQDDSTRVIPDVVVMIQDQSSGRNLMAAPVQVTSIFGTGQLPFLLPTPRFFRAQTQVVISVTNNSAATIYDLELNFIGTKFFKFAQGI